VVPSLSPKYVISVGLLAKSGYTVEFTGKGAKVKATNGHIVMNALCSSNNMYWIQNVYRQKPLDVPDLPSINKPVHLYMMNSDRSIETNDDSEISDHEITHSSVNHRPSSTSCPTKDKDNSRKHFRPPKEIILPYASMNLEDTYLNLSTSNSSWDKPQGKRRYFNAYDEADTESSTDITNPIDSQRPETANTGYDTNSNNNLVRPPMFQTANTRRRKSANIGQYYIQRLQTRIFGEYFDLDTSADNLMIIDTACSHHMTRQCFEDNQACIYYSRNPGDHQRTKHIDTKYHFVREQVKAGNIILEKIHTTDNLADLFTKPLTKKEFYNLIQYFMTYIH
jgi:hypothetical protein